MEDNDLVEALSYISDIAATFMHIIHSYQYDSLTVVVSYSSDESIFPFSFSTFNVMNSSSSVTLLLIR